MALETVEAERFRAYLSAPERPVFLKSDRFRLAGWARVAGTSSWTMEALHPVSNLRPFREEPK